LPPLAFGLAAILALFVLFFEGKQVQTNPLRVPCLLFYFMAVADAPDTLKKKRTRREGRLKEKGGSIAASLSLLGKQLAKESNA